MALELGPYGIRSNCVSPGFTHTEMTESAVGRALMEYLQGSFARVPMRRLVRPEEVAAAFVFLASDEASAITGTELRVDCGLTANWYILDAAGGGVRRRRRRGRRTSDATGDMSGHDAPSLR